MIAEHLIQAASSLPADVSALESAISALESAINARDSSSGLWETLAWVFTGTVVVGVVIEVCVIVLEHRDAKTAWKRGIVRPPDRPSYPLFMWGLIGSILVALGVAGEFGVGIKIALINGELRTKNAELRSKSEQLVALVTQEAGDAASSASSAKASADAASEEVKALSPRNLTPKQQTEIAAALKGVRSFPYPTRIESYGMDGEGTALATQLIRTLEATGYGTPGDGRADQIVSGGFEWGISIRGPAFEMPYMAALRDALVNIGKLQQVSINSPSPRVGASMGGAAGMGGTAGMGGGGGPPTQQLIPTQGPVSVMVGIRPPTVLPPKRQATINK